MGNWKSEQNINHFLENSYKELAQDFLKRGYDFYVDGFTSQPIFSVNIIKKDEDINWMSGFTRRIRETISLQCQTIGFENYKEMISILEEMGKDNYIFMFAIMPFQMRVATISCIYHITGVEHRKTRLRDKKLNELLNS